ncbi:MAG: serine hydrolase domain-containing protein, partial [Chloroflexota bacterium]
GLGWLGSGSTGTASSIGASHSPETPGPAASATVLPQRYVPDPVDYSAIHARLQTSLERERIRLTIPGVVASVVFPDGHVWSGTSGLADLATGRPLRPDTPFAVASVSKTFLAAEILSLIHEGRLQLEAAAAPLLPGVTVGGRSIDPGITIHQLLDHTSGLRDYLVDAALNRAALADPTAVWTPEQALSYAGSPIAKPGVGYHYSNTNYLLLGLVAEAITGRPLALEYRARFFSKLGMESATFQGVEPPVSVLPTAYRFASGAVNAKPIDVTDGTAVRPFTAITTASGGAGSVAASAPDLARWGAALYGGEILAASGLRAMIADAARTAKLRPGHSYGLGVQVQPIEGFVSYGHSGRLVGSRTVLRWFPDLDVAIAIVTNQSRYDPELILRALLPVAAPAAAGSADRE